MHETGYSEAGSCILSHDTHDVAVVTYSFFAQFTNAGECQDYCFAHNYTYHAFQNSTFHCLCGEEDRTVQCSDCNSSNVSSTYITMCSGTYMQVPGASHVLSKVALNFPSPVVMHTPTTFTLSGFPSQISSLSWDFGDGAKQENSNVAVVSHSYFYPGQFPVKVDLCGSGVCRTVQVQVKVAAENVQATLTCPTFSEVSGKINLNVTLSDSYESSVKWSRTTAAGTVHGLYNCVFVHS
ncbi:polycystin-1-like [Littorina saxatilis]|uniref:polycystin-1-like n=1 Tax=Littorina saxatilis TaxID=31220 RepID=UPI0038B467AC